MFLDARELPDGTRLETDVCVIGGGAAGMTIARELAGLSAQVALLESGGFEFDSDTQDPYKGRNVGLPYFDLDVTRLRFLGGSTNHWAGWCRPLDPGDFDPKPWLKESGWPIRFDDLAPFCDRACKIVELSDTRFDIEHWEKSPVATPSRSGACRSIASASTASFFRRAHRRGSAAHIVTILIGHPT